MAPPRCTCAFRLYHFNACMQEGGALRSCLGEPYGRKGSGHLDKEAAVDSYLGNSVDRASLPENLQDDPHYLLGFEEDGDLQVSSFVQCSTSRPAASQGGDQRKRMAGYASAPG